MPRTLPTIALEDIRIASPCAASWAAMKGDDRVRFCGSCQKNVFNLSDMTREDAEALLEETEGRVCVRYYRRRDGTVITQDCPVGLRAVRRRLALIGAGLAAGLGLLAAFMGLRRGDAQDRGGWRERETMGAAVYEPEREAIRPNALPPGEPPSVPCEEELQPMMGAPRPMTAEPEVLMGGVAEPGD